MVSLIGAGQRWGFILDRYNTRTHIYTATGNGPLILRRPFAIQLQKIIWFLTENFVCLYYKDDRLRIWKYEAGYIYISLNSKGGEMVDAIL